MDPPSFLQLKIINGVTRGERRAWQMWCYLEIHHQESPSTGFWEHLVGLTASALKKILGRRHISQTLLETIIVKIEAMINDRPLTFVLGDVEPLTPEEMVT